MTRNLVATQLKGQTEEQFAVARNLNLVKTKERAGADKVVDIANGISIVKEKSWTKH